MDLIEPIPNPIELPTKMLCDFGTVLETLGVWCAERAALILVIKLEKLKTCEKYERHFLILSTLYTEMIRVQKICDMAFGDLSDTEKMVKFAKPKLLKLIEIFKEYKPDHIQQPGIFPGTTKNTTKISNSAKKGAPLPLSREGSKKSVTMDNNKNDHTDLQTNFESINTKQNADSRTSSDNKDECATNSLHNSEDCDYRIVNDAFKEKCCDEANLDQRISVDVDQEFDETVAERVKSPQITELNPSDATCTSESITSQGR